MTHAEGKHDWWPAPLWTNHHGGSPLEAFGYRRLWCWMCRIVVDTPSHKVRVARQNCENGDHAWLALGPPLPPTDTRLWCWYCKKYVNVPARKEKVE